ncbi:MAG: hypothetical protein K9H65_05245 [Bacteroidales bacterium]|nr:hypothetical protein [Bacteroidales bacterium]
METADPRKSIHKLIDQADEKLLRMVHSLALEYLKDDKEIVAYKAGKTITKEQLYNELIEAEKAHHVRKAIINKCFELKTFSGYSKV